MVAHTIVVNVQPMGRSVIIVKKKNHFANVCPRRKVVKEIQHTITESSDDEYFIDIIYVNDCDRKDRLLCDCIYRSPTKEKALIVQSTIKICEVISEGCTTT